MTDDFRCKSCDRILTQGDEFDLGTCRECEPRPLVINSHRFDEQPDGTCGVCGYVESFGRLHPVELLDVPDDPRPVSCLRCGHFDHAGRCPDALPGIRPRPCPCDSQGAA